MAKLGGEIASYSFTFYLHMHLTPNLGCCPKSRVQYRVPVVIECKTDVDTKILHDTIYKQAALGKHFGLRVKSIILTLGSGLKQNSMDRGSMFDIKIFDSMEEEKKKMEFLTYVKNL